MKHIVSALLFMSTLVLADPKTPPFATCNLIGQLGNQLFQVAATYALAREYGARPLFPCLAHPPDGDQNGIAENYRHVFFRLDTSRLPTPPSHYYRYRPMAYRKIPLRPNLLIDGFYQSERYFCDYKEEILELFAPSQEILDHLHDHYDEIIRHPCSVAVHVRRYTPSDAELHINYPKEYYLEAMRLFPEDVLFVIFSNDMGWCENAFSNSAKHMRFIKRGASLARSLSYQLV